MMLVVVTVGLLVIAMVFSCLFQMIKNICNFTLVLEPQAEPTYA